MRRETERIQAELAERELEEARQMLEAAKKKGGAKGLKIKDGAPLNKQARNPLALPVRLHAIVHPMHAVFR